MVEFSFLRSPRTYGPNDAGTCGRNDAFFANKDGQVKTPLTESGIEKSRAKTFVLEVQSFTTALPACR